MTNNISQADDEDDADTAAFLRVARAAVTLADPVPTEVTELAKLAFEFRQVETVDFVDTSELAGVRSGSAVANTLRAAKGETTILWSIEDGRLTGVVHSAANATVAVQTQTGSTPVVLNQADGSFGLIAPVSAYRLVVSDGQEWATPWTN